MKPKWKLTRAQNNVDIALGPCFMPHWLFVASGGVICGCALWWAWESSWWMFEVVVVWWELHVMVVSSELAAMLKDEVKWKKELFRAHLVQSIESFRLTSDRSSSDSRLQWMMLPLQWEQCFRRPDGLPISRKRELDMMKALFRTYALIFAVRHKF